MAILSLSNLPFPDTPSVSIGGATLLLAFVLAYVSRQRKRKYDAIPCVEPRLPVIGNTLSLDMSRCHLVLTEWAKRVGPVFRMRIYNDEILVLNDYDSVHDALVTKGSDFAGRPPMHRTNVADRQKHSIVWQTYTPKLQFLRKEVLRWMKMDSAGQENLEQKCFPEIETIVGRIENLEGKGFDPREYIFDAVLNIMMGITFGQNLDPSDPKIQRLKAINKLFNDVFGSGSARMLDFLPWVKAIFCPDYVEKHKDALRLRDEFWEQELKELRADSVGRDCIVQQLLDISTQDSGHQMDVKEQTAKEVFTNLILAGTDTTTTALVVLLLALVHKPEVQDKMWAEIRDFSSTNRYIRLSDRGQLPYCHAVILEVLRFSSHVPLAVPHYTTKDTDVLGIRVPKDMTTYINLWAVHHDPKHWADPYNFDPSRFLDSSGELVPLTHPARRKLMPFGAGRRVCLAEALAKNRLFLFAAALVQRFNFLPPEDASQLPPLDSRKFEMGLVIHPQRFQIRAELRN